MNRKEFYEKISIFDNPKEPSEVRILSMLVLKVEQLTERIEKIEAELLK